MPWIQRNKAGTYRVAWREGGRGTPKKTVAAGETLAEARKIRDVVAGRIREGRIGGGVIAKRITVGEFAEKWLSMREGNVRPKTFERERYIVKNHILHRFRDEMLHAVSVEEAQAFIADLKSPWTARRVHDVTRVMFGDAQRYGYCRENVFWNVARPEKPHHEMRVLSVEGFCKLLKALSSKHRSFVLTLGLTGMRYGEATGLRWEDLDLEAGRLHIRRQIVSNTTEVAEPKSRTSLRTIDLLPPVRGALLDLPQRSEWVFPGTRGGSLNHRAFLRRVWCPTVEALKLGRLRIHDMRHLAASLWIAWGRNILWVASQLGHSSADITLRQYGHLLREGQRLDEGETLQKVEAAYRANSVPTRRKLAIRGTRINTGRGGGI